MSRRPHSRATVALLQLCQTQPRTALAGTLELTRQALHRLMTRRAQPSWATRHRARERLGIGLLDWEEDAPSGGALELGGEQDPQASHGAELVRSERAHVQP